ncbi:MAG: transglutaminase domain-containing protein [Clostridia bacterium]|nr:transglutaminase domain-containing protein [Clostridia bacterium]
MSPRVRETIARTVLTLLLSLGLVLPLMGVLQLPASGWVTGCVCAAVLSLALGAFSQMPKVSWIPPVAALVAAGVWLAAGGAEQAGEVLRALTLRLNGVPGGLSYVAVPAGLLLAFPLTLLAFAFTGRRTGVFALLAVILALMVLWLGQRGDLIPLLIPAGAAALTVYARERSEGTPLYRILPVLLAATALAAVLVPASGVTIPPLKEAADNLRQTILDYFFFTEPRNIFTLASEGYYPQGLNQLGGKPDISDHEVMTVETDRAVYLRGVVLNTYDGHAWHDTTGGRRYLWVSARWRSERERLFDENLPAGTELPAQTVRITLETDSASSLFVPQRVRSLSVSGNLVPYFNNASEIFATRDQAPGDSYSATAPLLTGGESDAAEIVSACEPLGDPARDAEVAALYTVLPDHLRDPNAVEIDVYALAREITSGKETPYDKALAIRDWLRADCRYTLNVAPHNPNRDFVTAFLVSREGYCTYFATAMTVLCRAAGLPARYVEGYLAEPGTDGIAYVTGLNGHAWTEVWFSGYGWLTFDATPSEGESSGVPPQMPQTPQAPEPTPTPTPTPPPPENAPENEPTPTPTPRNNQSEDEPEQTPPPPEDEPEDEPPENEDDPQDQAGPELPSDWWKWLLLVLLILLVIALVVMRFVWTSPSHRAKKAKDERGRWQVWMQAVADALAALGEHRASDQTLAQWLAGLDAKRLSPAPLAPLGECAALVFYGGNDPMPEETAMTEQAFRQLFASMKRGSRMRFRMHRAFGRKHDFTK